MDAKIDRLFPGIDPKPWKLVNLDTEYTKRKSYMNLNMSNNTDQEILLSLVTERNHVRTYGGFAEDRTKIWDGFEQGSPKMIHLGVDFNNLTVGQPVASVTYGLVVFTEVDDTKFNGWGGRIIIRNEELYLMYGHLENLTVQKGDLVSPGQVLGEIGHPDFNGGWFPHLHFQVVTKRYVDGYTNIGQIDGYAPFLPEGVLDPLSVL